MISPYLPVILSTRTVLVMSKKKRILLCTYQRKSGSKVATEVSSPRKKSKAGDLNPDVRGNIPDFWKAAGEHGTPLPHPWTPSPTPPQPSPPLIG